MQYVLFQSHIQQYLKRPDNLQVWVSQVKTKDNISINLRVCPAVSGFWLLLKVYSQL